MTDTNGTSITRRGVHRERHGRRRRGGARRHAGDGAGDHAEDVRAHPRRLARRLVLAAGLRPARAQGPQGVLADAHRRRRALAPVEQGRRPRHPHHRHRQRAQMGRPQGRLPGGAFLRRLAGLGRARADRRPGVLDRLARRLQAGERPARHRLRLRVQPQGAAGGGREGRARPPRTEGRGFLRQREGPRLGRFQAHAAAQRRRAAADQAHRRAREGGEEEGLYRARGTDRRWNDRIRAKAAQQPEREGGDQGRQDAGGLAGEAGQEAQKDKDARWTKKHDKSFYGYKNDIGIDSAHKLIRRYAETDASVHDSQMLDDVLDKSNTGADVWADSAYRSAEIEAKLEARGYKSRVHRWARRNRPLSRREQAGNTTRSRVRARVEHVFGHQPISAP